MNRFLRFLCATLPLFAAEAIQYIVYSMLLLIHVELNQGILYLYSIIGISVSGFVFIYWYRYEIQGESRGQIRSIITVKNMVLFPAIGVGCQFFFTGLLSLLVPYFHDIFAKYSNVVDRLTSGNHMLVLLLVLFVAPITEELIFRGVILHMANRHITFLGANVLQAILFGIYHGNLVQGIYAALLGLLLGTVYYKFKSIFASIFLHILINASSYLVALMPNSILFYMLLMAAGGILFIIAIIMLQPSKSVLLPETNKKTELLNNNLNNN